MGVDPIQDIFDVEEGVDSAQLTTANQAVMDRCTLTAFVISSE
jgi:hypothetical protein